MRGLFLKIEEKILGFYKKKQNSVIAFVPFLIWFVFTCFLLFKPSSGKTKSAFIQFLAKMQVDKLVHGLIFFCLLLLLSFPLYFLKKQKGWIIYTLFLFFIWAFLTEWIQLEFVANRDFDLFDIVADILGLFLGFLYFSRLVKYKIE